MGTEHSGTHKEQDFWITTEVTGKETIIRLIVAFTLLFLSDFFVQHFNLPDTTHYKITAANHLQMLLPTRMNNCHNPKPSAINFTD